ncbi:MAG: rubrerythrin family protein [Thermoplasmata archaeon]|nr:rubrerythrin family protein [Thermoplasmata archaeon]
MKDAIKKKIMEFQKNEITEHEIYRILAKRVGGKNGEILKKISLDEKKHYMQWKKYTGEDVKPSRFAIFKYSLLQRIFGITFAVKLMERGEENAEKAYEDISREIPEAKSILEDEFEHEDMLLKMLDERKISYLGSMVLGINDAMVELTGALAGLTFALENARVTGFVGFITGMAASLSMASSDYLSKKSEGGNPVRAAFYTGIAYLITVILLILPYFLLNDYRMALFFTICMAIFVIYIFTFFIAVVKDMIFWKLFMEMAAISMGIAFISFLIGWSIRVFFNIQI